MKQNKPAAPCHISLLGAQGLAPHAYCGADLIKELWLWLWLGHDGDPFQKNFGSHKFPHLRYIKHLRVSIRRYAAKLLRPHAA